MVSQIEKYPARNTFLPVGFGDAPSDNKTVLSFSDRIYADPFAVLTPAASVLGANKKSTKISTTIAFGDFYVVWAIGTTLYKIGVSKNFERRFKDLAANSPLPLTVIRYARCDHPHLLENHLHDRFKAKLFKNEWFSLDDADISHIATLFDRYFERPS